jgi:hypothetical protein
MFVMALRVNESALSLIAGYVLRCRTPAETTDESPTTSAASPNANCALATIRAPGESGANALTSAAVNVATDRYAALARSRSSVNAAVLCCPTDQ